MMRLVRHIAKGVARQIIGRLPQMPSRLTGALAIHGGKPVRDVRFRPWVNSQNRTLVDWMLRGQGNLRRAFLSGVEGLPQPMAKQFAQEWAEYCGCRYGLLLPHGTDALRIGLASALEHDGLEYGGEVIVPNLSFIASATAALDRRFGIVLVDVDAETLLLDPKRVEEAVIPGKTRAIIPVHQFGQAANMTSIRDVANRHGLMVVEDAAQSHGAVSEDGPAGSLGDVAGFSFQSFKNLSCGEGGALTTNSEAIFDRAYSMQNAGRARIGEKRWEHVSLGWNCRPTEYQAALLLCRFSQFKRQQETRLKNFYLLRELLKDIACVRPLAIHSSVQKHGAHMFAMRYRSEYCGNLPIDEFLRACAGEGAPIDRGYSLTIAEQPAIKELSARYPDFIRFTETPIADQAVKELIYIPQGVFLGTEQDMHDIVALLNKVERHYSRRSHADAQATGVAHPVKS